MKCVFQRDFTRSHVRFYFMHCIDCAEVHTTRLLTFHAKEIRA